MKMFLPFLAVPAAALILSASCTTVSFQVEHPPVVDLRNINTITVIPFEWNSAGRNAALSRHATSALVNGIRTGKLEYVDPQVLENVSVKNYWKYTDAYITGRIINAGTNRYTETKEESHWNYYSNEYETVTVRVTTITTTVEIEYSYIRSADSKVLGYFRKSETYSGSYEHPRDRNRNFNRNRREYGPGIYRQGKREDTGFAEAAIEKFSYSMSRETGPYTTNEKRNIKTGTGNDRRVTEANRLIRQNRYDEALVLYGDIYARNPGAAAGYNTAVLLAANGKYAGALALLTNLNKKTEDAGKRSPPYILKEIKKLTEFINGFRLLELYGKNEAVSVPGSVSGTSPRNQEPGPQTAFRKIQGTANISEAEIYALNDPITSAKDPSVFKKLAASSGANGGRWSMEVPVGGPASLWFVLIEDDRNSYISKTPLDISAAVVLDTALMNRLEEQ